MDDINKDQKKHSAEVGKTKRMEDQIGDAKVYGAKPGSKYLAIESTGLVCVLSWWPGDRGEEVPFSTTHLDGTRRGRVC